MVRVFRPEDEGKPVVTKDGDVVGSIVRIDEGDAYVRPKSELLRGCGSWLTSSWDADGEYPLDRNEVASIHDTAVVIETPSTYSLDTVSTAGE